MVEDEEKVTLEEGEQEDEYYDIFDPVPVEETYIDDRFINDKDKEILKNAFLAFDADNSGSIECEELGDLLRSLGQEPSDEQVQELMKALDIDGSGKIELEEFMGLMEERAVIPDWNEDDEEKLFIKAFETLDPNNTGKIPANELRELLRDVVTSYGSMRLSEEEAEELIKRADLNQDGQVSYDEFMRLFLGKNKTDELLTVPPESDI